VPDTTQSTVAKVVGALTAFAAAAAAQRLVSAGWQAARGHKPPAAEDPETGVRLSEVVAAAAITGALVAVARVLATRSAARFAARVEAGRTAH
jgi:hypothetical protein